MGRIFILLILIAGVISCTDNSKKVKIQIKRNDSLDYFLEKSYNDTVPYKMKCLYADKALAIVSKGKNDSMNRVNYFKVANRYFYLMNIKKYKSVSYEIINRSKNSEDSLSLGKAYMYLADVSTMDSMYLFYFKAGKLFKKINASSNLASALLRKSWLQYVQKDYSGSEKNTLEALKILKSINNKDLLVSKNLIDAYNYLGAISVDLSEFDNAIMYYLKALDIHKKNTHINFFEKKETILNNIGIVYERNKNYKKAIFYYELALKDSTLHKFRPNLYAILKNSLTYSRFKLGYKKRIIEDYNIALKISDSVNDKRSAIFCQLNIAAYFLQKKDLKKAKEYTLIAYTDALQNKFTAHVLESLKQLTQVDPTNAAKYFTEYNKLNDSLQLAERRNRDKFARIEYETEELVTDKKNLIEEREKYLYTSIAFLLLLTVIIVFGYYVLKNRQTQLQREQEKANAEIYQLMLEQGQKVEEGKRLEKKRISQELHDGVMGKLTSIRLNLFVLKKKTDPETIEKCIVHINEIQDIEKEIRTIAYDLQKNVLSGTLSFDTVVKKLFKDIENHSDINFKLQSDENISWITVDNKVKMQIYRILQEAIQNIDKYANAKNVVISMKAHDKLLFIEITDDGVGFEESKIEKGIGIKSMYTRAKEINGEIFINSVPGKGTSIKLKVQA